jgi:hypothetical protein
MITENSPGPEHHRGRRFRIVDRNVLFLGLALLALTPGTTPAEEPTPVAAPAPTTPPAPVAIPLADMAERAEEAARVLSKAVSVMEPDTQVADIQQQATKRLADLDERVDKALLTAEEASSPQALLELDFSWTSRRRDIRAAIKTLTKRLRTLDEQITLLAGAFGVGIGFGLQNVVNNFTSGLVLLFERPISVGDAVQIGELFGEVRRIGLRSSTLRTFQGAEVIVPNANLISDQVTNWTLSDRNRRIELPVGIEYGTDPEQVIQLLINVAKAHPDVMAYPEPGALFIGFGDSSLDFELRAWTSQFDSFLRIKSELAIGINNALRDAGITIPFPQRDLHVRSVDPAAAAQLLTKGPQRPAELGEQGEGEPATQVAGSGSPPRSFNRN